MISQEVRFWDDQVDKWPTVFRPNWSQFNRNVATLRPGHGFVDRSSVKRWNGINCKPLTTKSYIQLAPMQCHYKRPHHFRLNIASLFIYLAWSKTSSLNDILDSWRLLNIDSSLIYPDSHPFSYLSFLAQCGLHMFERLTTEKFC